MSQQLKTKDRRNLLPYVVYVCEDWTMYLANRDYSPIWKRSPGQIEWQPVTSPLRVENIKVQIHLYNDADVLRFHKSEEGLAQKVQHALGSANVGDMPDGWMGHPNVPEPISIW